MVEVHPLPYIQLGYHLRFSKVQNLHPVVILDLTFRGTYLYYSSVYKLNFRGVWVATPRSYKIFAILRLKNGLKLVLKA